jgi:TPP-dependent pyruvate/acetoin dehydrogenase alpha subunit
VENSREELQGFYYQMRRIHKVQRRIEELYHLDDIKTPVHLCIGQEAIAVGFCAPLKKEDYITSNHRSHGHYLAKGGDLKALIAELYCRETGCSKGRGGSMHVVDTSVGHMGSSSIVGGGIPIGTGLGFASQMKKDGLVSVVFFGDGAADEGVLYESVNFAILKKLPVVFFL